MSDKGDKNVKAFAIRVPLACTPSSQNITQVSPAGGVVVIGTPNDASLTLEAAKALVYRAGATPPTPPPPEAADGYITPAKDEYFFDDTHKNRAPGAVAAMPTAADPNAHSSDNLLAVWEKYEEESYWREPDLVPLCCQVSATAQVSVDARDCLWFAWAPIDIASLGPFDEVVNNHRPKELIVPTNAVTAVVSANDSQLWQHLPKVPPHPRSVSNADGLNGLNGTHVYILGLIKPEYRSATYQSEAISVDTTTGPNHGGVRTHCNKLVGAWQIGHAVPPADSSTPEIVFGVGPTSETVPTTPRAVKLFLAMHDGQEWNDNHDSVDVTVSWL